MVAILALVFVLDDFEAELSKLRKEYSKAEEEFFRPYREAKTDEERRAVKLDYGKHPQKEYAGRFGDLGKRAKGTDAGVRAWIQAFRLYLASRNKEEAEKALGTILADGIESPALEELTRQLQWASSSIGAKALEALRTMAEKSPHRGVKAAALFTLGAAILSGGKGMEREQIEARKCLETVMKEYADTRYAKLAEGYLFELENLQVGKTAPDFEATDQDGKPFKLSDYRGKVVVIDFWGFW